MLVRFFLLDQAYMYYYTARSTSFVPIEKIIEEVKGLAKCLRISQKRR